jgi:hypothetical protein
MSYLHHADFLFGDDPDEGFYFDDATTLDDTGQDWTLPSVGYRIPLMHIFLNSNIF